MKQGELLDFWLQQLHIFLKNLKKGFRERGVISVWSILIPTKSACWKPCSSPHRCRAAPGNRGCVLHPGDLRDKDTATTELFMLMGESEQTAQPRLEFNFPWDKSLYKDMNALPSKCTHKHTQIIHIYLYTHTTFIYIPHTYFLHQYFFEHYLQSLRIPWKYQVTIITLEKKMGTVQTKYLPTEMNFLGNKSCWTHTIQIFGSYATINRVL